MKAALTRVLPSPNANGKVFQQADQSDSQFRNVLEVGHQISSGHLDELKYTKVTEAHHGTGKESDIEGVGVAIQQILLAIGVVEGSISNLISYNRLLQIQYCYQGYIDGTEPDKKCFSVIFSISSLSVFEFQSVTEPIFDR